MTIAIEQNDNLERDVAAREMRQFEANHPSLEFSRGLADRVAIGSLLVELALLERQRSIGKGYRGMDVLKSWLTRRAETGGQHRVFPALRLWLDFRRSRQ